MVMGMDAGSVAGLAADGWSKVIDDALEALLAAPVHPAGSGESGSGRDGAPA